jgi:hypothetical protein
MAEEWLEMRVEVHVLVGRISELMKPRAIIDIGIVELDYNCVGLALFQTLIRKDDPVFLEHDFSTLIQSFIDLEGAHFLAMEIQE